VSPREATRILRVPSAPIVSTSTRSKYRNPAESATTEAGAGFGTTPVSSHCDPPEFAGVEGNELLPIAEAADAGEKAPRHRTVAVMLAPSQTDEGIRMSPAFFCWPQPTFVDTAFLTPILQLLLLLF
jgi:hypothetical protein